MIKLSGKTIYIISYENWGPMLMSKHHYAIALAQSGNTVFFINHPDKRKALKRGEVLVQKTEVPNLSYVEHRLFVPYFLKFKLKWLYNLAVSLHVNKIINKTGRTPDIVWSFDTGNTIPLKFFRKATLRILMPVDGPFNHSDERRSAESANAIISVTERILSVFKERHVPKLLVNHGVADVFLKDSNHISNDKNLRAGYSGSLIRNDLDTESFLSVINSHPEITFEFWGETNYKKSNIHLPQDVEPASLRFIETLRTLPNVILHGPVDSATLAQGLKRMDVLLIFYKIKNDQNHHKVLEYLGTGKVIVSNYMSSYADSDEDLICMDKSDEGGSRLVDMFNSVVASLESYNSPDKQKKRKDYANQYSYASNIKRIEDFLNAEAADKLHH
jgi:hypothetical protein